jgi:hypothetical protein
MLRSGSEGGGVENVDWHSLDADQAALDIEEASGWADGSDAVAETEDESSGRGRAADERELECPFEVIFEGS